jgi:hypothetical protein
MFELNYEQSSVVKLVKDGHNVLIMGQAGVGKTEVVRHIIRNALAVGRKVAVVCSTGIACDVYEPGVASTVNSRYGLQTSDLPWKQVVNRAAENSLVINNVRSVNVIIWDEAGMSSQRTFEIVNALHHELADDEVTKLQPFAGKQIILVGEFLQLKPPVPNALDDGSFMFHSPIFTSVIPHRVELTRSCVHVFTIYFTSTFFFVLTRW